MQRLGILVLVFCIACKPSPQTKKNAATAAGPTVRATVITLRTTTLPSKRTVTQTIVIAGDRARDTSERDAWRLYDTKAQTVTFVDDIDRTARTQAFDALSKSRRDLLASAMAPYHPKPTLKRDGEKKTIQGVTAQQWLIASGAYKRELWIGEHPSIPRGLFAMMLASESISSRELAPIMKEIDNALLDAKGFPLVDRSEVPIGNAPMIVERAVISVAQKDVPQSWIEVPKGYARK